MQQDVTLAGQMRSPLWLLSRLNLIPKPSDNPSAPITLRPLGLPENFYRLAGRRRAAVRKEGPLVGPTMEPVVQRGVGIPFGCQIEAKGAPCSFDGRPQGSIGSGSDQRLQQGETTEQFLPWSAAPPLLYVRLRTRDATDLAWTACGLERDGGQTRRSGRPPLLRSQHSFPLLLHPRRLLLPFYCEQYLFLSRPRLVVLLAV